jgi:Cu-Zn family superoxide dismutase
MKAIAIFNDNLEDIKGIINFEQKSPNSPLQMSIKLQGFNPYSIHAIHIHEFGDLTEGCKSLGGHFNPTNKQHSHSEKGHAGDLFNNFQSSKDGKINIVFTTNKLSIFPTSKLSIIGRSVVIHKFPDDYGLEGMYMNKDFVLYKDMNIQELQYVYNLLGYNGENSIQKMKNKLITESKTTGNASTRIACAIIGLSKM